MIVTLSTRRRDAFLRWRNALSAAVPPVLRQLLRVATVRKALYEHAHVWSVIVPRCIARERAARLPFRAPSVEECR